MLPQSSHELFRYRATTARSQRDFGVLRIFDARNTIPPDRPESLMTYTCPICCEEEKASPFEIAYFKACVHHTCLHCAQKWLDQCVKHANSYSCPMCRKTITSYRVDKKGCASRTVEIKRVELRDACDLPFAADEELQEEFARWRRLFVRSAQQRDLYENDEEFEDSYEYSAMMGEASDDEYDV
jgi:hypothetical protein